MQYFTKKEIYWENNERVKFFLSNVFNLWNFLTKLELPLHGNNLFYLHIYVTQELIVSCCHPNFIFASPRGSRVLMVMNEMFCNTVFKEKTFNINIMLKITRITIVNRVHAKNIVLFAVSHCDVAHLLIFYTTVYRLWQIFLNSQR